MKAMGLEPNMHLTCTNVERKDVIKAFQTCKDNDVRNIVASPGRSPPRPGEVGGDGGRV